MFANSRTVISDQQCLHPRLHLLVGKHQQQPVRRPVTARTRACFARLAQILAGQSAPVIIDAGCGTGVSSRMLARRYPDHWVIGIDKSAHRLARAGLQGDLIWQDNCVLLCMKLEDFYPLAVSHTWQAEQQYFLYPNPWPKARHVQRRWYAHAVFPWIIQLGGKIELRCNWALYASEFIASFRHYTDYVTEMATMTPAPPFLSPFECKYAASGQQLYRCLAVSSQHPRFSVANHRRENNTLSPTLVSA